MRRFHISLVLGLLLLGMTAAPAAAQVDGGRCAERFPDVEFDHSTTAGPVGVYGAGVPEGVLDRYGRDFGVLVDWIIEEMGGLDDSVVVCMFQNNIPLDAQALGWPEGQALRAVAFADEGIVVLSNWFPRHVPGAGYNGLIHVAQYRVSDGDYPEPFGTEVKGWYRNRLERSVDAVHNFYVRQNSGLSEPWAPFPWTVGRMVDPILWNPEFGYGGGGDFANFAVANGPETLLSDPLGSDLETLDEGWRQALFDESGAVPGGSRGWLTGLSVTIAVLAVGVFMPWWNRRQKRKFEAQLRDLPWLEEQSRLAREREAVRTSIATGGGGGDPRVGRGGSPSSGVDGDDGDGSPSGGTRRSRRDRMSSGGESGDDLFRHPGFDEEG
jgi:hypothetical protein